MYLLITKIEKSVQIIQLIDALYLVKWRKVLSNTLYKNTHEYLLNTFYLVSQSKLQKIKMYRKSMKRALTELLMALYEARKDLVSRTVNEDSRLFSCLFQYEDQENLLLLSFEREYSIFINCNLEKISNYVTDFDGNYSKEKIKYIVEEFIGFKESRSTSVIDSFFLIDKINQIEKIFSIFDKSKDRLDELNYIKNKDQVLFDRQFRLLGE